MHCPLCKTPSCIDYHTDQRRDYHQCPHCDLVFVPATQLPSLAREKQEYDLHQNHADDMGYRNFISKLTTPLSEELFSGSYGLDFGCGPTPVLSNIMHADGHHCVYYDPIYHPNHALLNSQYDFVTCSEVVEHFHRPADMFEQLYELVVPKGWLAIMTKRVINRERFTTWHYKNDPTHVCFYSDKTFQFLAHKYHYKLKIVSADVVLLQKSV